DADAVDNSCYAMSGVVSRNVYGQDQDHASWTMKLRLCVGSLGPGTIDNSIAGCTTATLINCDQNGAVDFPCGGHHSITNSVLNVGQGAQGGHGSFYMIKYGEEIQFGAGFCPTLSGATNTITADNVIFIFDAPDNDGIGPWAICTYQDTS